MLVRWLSTWVWMAGIGPVATFGLLLFPDGRLPSPRWRAFAWFAAAAVVATARRDRLRARAVRGQHGREPARLRRPAGAVRRAPERGSGRLGPGDLRLDRFALRPLPARPQRRAPAAQVAHLRRGRSSAWRWPSRSRSRPSWATGRDLTNTIISLALAAVPVAIGDRDPAPPAVRHRRRHQPHAGLRRAHRDARRRVPRRSCCCSALAVGDVGPRGRRVDAGGRGAVPARCAARIQALGRPALLPPPLRRRADARGVRRPPARRDRPRGARRRPARVVHETVQPAHVSLWLRSGAMTAPRLAWACSALWCRRSARAAPPLLRDATAAHGFDVLFMLGLTVFAVVGAHGREPPPRNPIGWILEAVVLFSGRRLASPYGYYDDRRRPGCRSAAWLDDWIADRVDRARRRRIPLLFPDGRLPSPRWRPVAWLPRRHFALGVLGRALRRPRLDTEAPGARVENPYALPGAAGDALADVAIVLRRRLRCCRRCIGRRRRWSRASGARTASSASSSSGSPRRLLRWRR